MSSSEPSLAEAVGRAKGRYNPVEAAYDGMNETDRKTFRDIIRANDYYTHAQVAAALREIGYDVDRKQVQHYRERLALGKVSL